MSSLSSFVKQGSGQGLQDIFVSFFITPRSLMEKDRIL